MVRIHCRNTCPSPSVSGVCQEDLALLRAVDATEANVFGVVVVEDFDGVAVEDRDKGTNHCVLCGPCLFQELFNFS